MSRLFHVLNQQVSGRRVLLRLLTTEQGQGGVKQEQRGKSFAAWMTYGGLAMLGGAVAFGVYLEQTSMKAGDLVVHPHSLPWFHNASFWHGYDIKSVRRGYQVYKQVCAACHTVNLYCYRHFVDTIMTEDEAKAEAAELLVDDGPNEAGQMFTRPGKLTDRLPSPYKNETLAKLANNMAVPPDLMLITLARHGGEDYVFHLLTGYQDAPAGIEVGPGQAYNPYFPNGSVLSMAQQLFDDMLEYEDGTPATMSQLAKDVTTFLKYLAEPELPMRKQVALKILLLTIPLSFLLLYYKRFVWSGIKSQKVIFKTLKGREPPSSEITGKK